MKKATKVLLIIFTALNCISVVLSLFGIGILTYVIRMLRDLASGSSGPVDGSRTSTLIDVLLVIAYLAISGFEIFVALYTCKKIDEAKTSKDLTLWGVLNIIFVNPIAGILVLCLDSERLRETN